jgi:carboxynorspermidine decarboxylase
VINLAKLAANLGQLAEIQDRAQCKVLLALKGFATWPVFPLVRRSLAGAAASSLHEARLAREELGTEVHIYAPAYAEPEFDALLSLADHLVFNSFAQWKRFRKRALQESPRVSFGIRVNPEHSEVKTALYDPCAPGSRLGVTEAAFEPDELEGISGLHVHALCQSGAEALVRMVESLEARFGRYLGGLRWLNLGGGHHITRPGYNVDLLVQTIAGLRARYGIEIYLEPGEAIALDAGVLVASVLDIVENELSTAILDTSATAHMPDVLEMPYRPEIVSACAPFELEHTYRLAGVTCLAGDVIGDYSFATKLEVGSRLVFRDMAHYAAVKSTTFNGVRLPSLALQHADGRIERVRRFEYEDYRARLG